MIIITSVQVHYLFSVPFTVRPFPSINQSNSAVGEVKGFSHSKYESKCWAKCMPAIVQHLPWWGCKGAINAFVITLRAVSSWLAEEQSPRHIITDINLLTISFYEPTINKFLPIRNKLTALCWWVDKNKDHFKANWRATLWGMSEIWVFLINTAKWQRKLVHNGCRSTKYRVD